VFFFLFLGVVFFLGRMFWGPEGDSGGGGVGSVRGGVSRIPGADRSRRGGREFDESEFAEILD
jgi:hypothetical protein